jgi:hypothetical protein
MVKTAIRMMPRANNDLYPCMFPPLSKLIGTDANIHGLMNFRLWVVTIHWRLPGLDIYPPRVHAEEGAMGKRETGGRRVVLCFRVWILPPLLTISPSNFYTRQTMPV